MGSALEATLPLASVSPAFMGRGLSLGEVAAVAILHLEGPRGGAASALGLAALPESGRAVSLRDGTLLRAGPDSYLLLGEGADRQALTGDFAVVIDMTDAWTRLAIEGANARALLAKGCALDFYDHSFPAGACATAGFARLRAVIWRPGQAPRYEFLVGRSYALSLWDWFMDAAAEYGRGGNNAAGEP